MVQKPCNKPAIDSLVLAHESQLYLINSGSRQERRFPVDRSRWSSIGLYLCGEEFSWVLAERDIASCRERHWSDDDAARSWTFRRRCCNPWRNQSRREWRDMYQMDREPTAHTVFSSRGSSNRYPISFRRISGYFYIQLFPMDESHDDVLLIGIFHELSHHPKWMWTCFEETRILIKTHPPRDRSYI